MRKIIGNILYFGPPIALILFFFTLIIVLIIQEPKELIGFGITVVLMGGFLGIVKFGERLLKGVENK